VDFRSEPERSERCVPPLFSWHPEPPEPPDSPFFSCLRYPAEAGSARVVMVGELDVSVASLARVTLRHAQNSASTVTCDLGDVSFIDLRGLRVLLEATEHARCTGARFSVLDAPGVVSELVAELGLQGALATA
jgi:anti-anti-sigma factor